MKIVPFNLYYKVLGILLVAGIYATLRYVVFGSVYWGHIPVYILNKTMAIASVYTLLLSAYANLKKDNKKARDWGTISLHLVIYHVGLSLLILTPEYYPYWFWKGKLTFLNEINLTFGVFSTYCYIMLFMTRPQTLHMAVFKILASFAAGVHIFAMAYGTWFNPQWWPGHMPPISLWSFIFVLGTFLIYMKRQELAPEATN